MLCTGTSGGDATLPGFANMVQGELAAPPMATSSQRRLRGWARRARSTRRWRSRRARAARALVATSEVPSRLFKRSRFASRGYDIDFDAHFLRWMLSDAAGALAARARSRAGARPLKLLGVHLRSFSGDYPVCMQVGPRRRLARGPTSTTNRSPPPKPTAPSRCGRTSACCRICSTSASTSTSGWSQSGWIDPRADRSLPLPLLVAALRAGRARSARQGRAHDSGRALVQQPQDWRGNTGAASIFVMLARLSARARREARRAHPLLRAGVRPLHGRLRAVRGRRARGRCRRGRATPAAIALPPPPHDPDTAQRSADAHAARGSWPRSGTTIARARGAHRSCRASPAADVTDADIRALDGGLDPAGATGQHLDAQGRRAPRRSPCAALRELVTAHAATSSTTFGSCSTTIGAPAVRSTASRISAAIPAAKR